MSTVDLDDRPVKTEAEKMLDASIAKTVTSRAPTPPIAVKLDREALAKALATILAANEKRCTIPVLSGVLFEIETASLRVTATNMDQWLTAGIDAAADRPARFVLLEPAGLARLLKLLDLDDLALNVDPPVAKVTLTSGKVEAEFNILPADDFPLWTRKAQQPVDLHFGGTQLIQAIDRVAFAISTEETRYYLNGICLDARSRPEGGFEPWMIATDGHKLAMARVEQELSVEASELLDRYFKVIIPRQAVPMLRDIAMRGAVEIRLWDTAFAIEQDGFSFYSKLIDGTYPDYDRVIPSGNDKSAVFSPSVVIPAVKRAATLCKKQDACHQGRRHP